MKKNILAFISILLLFALSACSGQASTSSESSSILTVPDIPISESIASSQAVTPSSSEQVSNKQAGSIDIDLTQMSGNMVYAEVYNMMFSPQGNLGKTMKIKGLYNASFDDANKKYHHAVIVTDALACCSQGIEFVWPGEHIYPEDYPEVGAEIEVTGVFTEGVYNYDAETQYPYYYLNVSSINFE